MSAEAHADTIAKAQGMYLTLTGLTESPQEALNIICMMHLLLFMNHGDSKCSVEDMLSDYNHNFKKNWERNKARAS